jgi:hypothetical protein
LKLAERARARLINHLTQPECQSSIRAFKPRILPGKISILGIKGSILAAKLLILACKVSIPNEKPSILTGKDVILRGKRHVRRSSSPIFSGKTSNLSGNWGKLPLIKPQRLRQLPHFER